METLREGWAAYEREVIPDGFSDGSREIVQHAFYHGAIALLVIGHTFRTRGVTSEDERAAMLGRICDEIVEFDAGCQMKMLMHVLAGATR